MYHSQFSHHNFTTAVVPCSVFNAHSKSSVSIYILIYIMGLYKPSVSNTLKKIQKNTSYHSYHGFYMMWPLFSASFWVAVARKPQRTSAAFCTSLRPPGTTKLLRKGSEARPASEMEVVCPMIYHLFIYNDYWLLYVIIIQWYHLLLSSNYFIYLYIYVILIHW